VRQHITNFNALNHTSALMRDQICAIMQPVLDQFAPLPAGVLPFRHGFHALFLDLTVEPQVALTSYTNPAVLPDNPA